MFLIDNKESQFFKLNIFGKKPVGAYKHIYFAGLQVIEDFFLLCL